MRVSPSGMLLPQRREQQNDEVIRHPSEGATVNRGRPGDELPRVLLRHSIPPHSALMPHSTPEFGRTKRKPPYLSGSWKVMNIPDVSDRIGNSLRHMFI
nr:hypothetical protein CFP56_00414 [Quercus suber]